MKRTVADEVRLAARVARRAFRVPLVERRSDSLGLPPGSIPAPAADARPPRVTAFQYEPGLLEEEKGLSAAEARTFADRPGIAWIDVNGLADTPTIAAFGRAFGLHPLVIEDIVRTTQRPKMEVYDDYVYVVVRSIRATGATPGEAHGSAAPHVAGYVAEQISFVLGRDFVLTFQEDEGDVFDAVRERIRRGAGRVRSAGADYLVYALLDLVVDHTFVTLERMGDATETLEALALDDPAPAVQASISGLRREMALLRRALWPLRDVLAGLGREDTPFVDPATRRYLRDAYEHVVQAVEILESLREILSSLHDLYLSAIGLRQNEVMKVLTVISTVFLPLTFVAGVYGMNFDPDASPLNMPELRWFYGYPFALALMLAIAVGLLVLFRRKGWF